MKTSAGYDKPGSKDVGERKALLEAALEEEDRISRRQVLLKKLWKLNKQERELKK